MTPASMDRSDREMDSLAPSVANDRDPQILAPYLLFVGDATYAKTAHGVRQWRPELCLAQYRFPGSPIDLDLPDMTPSDAAKAGARTMLIGVAPAGGQLPDSWVPALVEALESGLDLAAGLHTRLNDHPVLSSVARRLGRTMHDVRQPTRDFSIGDFAPRTGLRLLTVGSDCAVGKKYTALAIERELRRRGAKASFRATGQTGLLIAGGGVVIDSVVADFIAAAAAWLSPAAEADHWDVIEGQGSLFHPAYAGVTLGLVHGSQPDAMVLCSDPTREMLGEFPLYPRPDLRDCVMAYEAAARLTNPRAQVIGISLNTAACSPDEAQRHLDAAATATGLPAVDPIRNDVTPIVDRMLEFQIP